MEIVKFTVTVEVEKGPLFDEKYLRQALMYGLEVAHKEGAMTALDDEETDIAGWKVSRAQG